MARYNFKCRTMEDNKPVRNYNRNQKTKVELDRAHNRKDYKAVERMALDWNPQSSRARGRPRGTWKRTVLEEIAKEEKTWNEVKKLVTNRVRWKYFVNALCSSRGDTGD